MSEQQIEIDVVESDESSNAMVSSLRRILMAGIGAVVLAQEEIEDFLDKMVDRGEIADADARKLLHDLREGHLPTGQEGVSPTSTPAAPAAIAPISVRIPEIDLDKQVGSVLSRLNIPTKLELDALNARIAELNEKVDELISLRQG